MCTLISVVHLYAENDMMLRYKRAAATCPGYRCTPHCSILTDKLVVRKCCGGKKKKGKNEKFYKDSRCVDRTVLCVEVYLSRNVAASSRQKPG